MGAAAVHQASKLVDGDFKFHLRVMVLAIDDLRVFVHDAAVALCAAERFGRRTA